jgi:DNA-binding transcriptional LysR family regulator
LIAQILGAEFWMALAQKTQETVRRQIYVQNFSRQIWTSIGSSRGAAPACPVLPRFIDPEAAGLIRVLPEAAPPVADCYFLYPAELRRLKRVAVFRDFLVRKIAESRISAESDAGADPAFPRRLAANESNCQLR